MSELKLSLEEGFDGDRVLITAGQHKLVDETAVTTRYQISLAKLLDLDVPTNEDRLTISLPDRGLETVIDLTDRPSHLRVSISRDGRQIETSTEAPIGYA